MSCQNNLLQLTLALQQYESAHERLPPGVVDAAGPIQNAEAGNHMSWIAHILPYLEQGNAFDQTAFTAGAYAPRNVPVRKLNLRVLQCASSSSGGTTVGVSNYAGCHHEIEASIDADQNGVLFLNSRVRYDQIGDGRSHTIFLGEKLWDEYNGKLTLRGGGGLPGAVVPGEEPGEGDPAAPAADPVNAAGSLQPVPPVAAGSLGDLGWMSGTRATLRNTGTPINRTGDGSVAFGRRNRTPPPAASSPAWVGGFESLHTGGAQFAFGDGAVRFLSEQIGMTVYQQLGHRADGRLLSDSGY